MVPAHIIIMERNVQNYSFNGDTSFNQDKFSSPIDVRNRGIPLHLQWLTPIASVLVATKKEDRS